MVATASQAIKMALNLRGAFSSHDLMLERRKVRERHPDVEPDIEALGLNPKLHDLIVWMTDEPNQEAGRYASALASAEPIAQVFVESEKVKTIESSEHLEKFYNGSIRYLFPDTYPYEIHLAADGFAVHRMDLRHEFWTGIPKRRTKNRRMPADEFNLAVDDHRANFGLPFEAVKIDPATFYYDQNKKGTRITVGAEWGIRRESVLKAHFTDSALKRVKKDLGGGEDLFNPTEPDDSSSSGGQKVQYVVYRDTEVVYHMIVGESGTLSGRNPDSTILWEGKNIFAPHTGYIAWRAKHTGFSDPQRKFDPFILASLNVAEIKSLFTTLQADFTVQAAQSWLEKESSRVGNPVNRAISAQAKTAKPGIRTESGRAAAEFGEGEHLTFREVAGDMALILERLGAEEERNQFSDSLMGEASASATGRGIIRLQEAAGRLLRQGMVAKKLAMEETLALIRHTLMNNKEKFFADGRKVFVPYIATGVGTDGFGSMKELIAIDESSMIPHVVEIHVEALSEAAQLARMEEGMKLEGRLSRDNIDHNWYGITDIPLENKRRMKDEIRKTTIPEIVKRAAADAMAVISGRAAPTTNIVIPELGEQTADGTGFEVPPGQLPPGGQPPGVSGRPTPPAPEDVGAGGGGRGGFIPGPPTGQGGDGGFGR